MPSHGISFTWDVSATKHPDRDWIAFREGHSDWVSGQQNNDGILHCLHPANIHASLQLYRLGPEFEAAEREFTVLCDCHHAIGVSCDRFLRYELLRPQLPWPPDHDLQEFLSLGWSPSDIACVHNMPNPTGKINHRLRAAARRLISMPSFNTAKSSLRLAWDQLPDQPKVHATGGEAAWRTNFRTDRNHSQSGSRRSPTCDCGGRIWRCENW